MVRIDRVRKSSGGIDGKLMLEKDLAADRSARSDAVRLDLNTARSGLKGREDDESVSATSASCNETKSSSSKSTALTASGCSSVVSDGERTGSRVLRIGLAILLRAEGLGLRGDSIDDTISVTKESPKDGIESAEMVLVMAEPILAISSSKLSGGDSNRSMGLPLLKVRLSSFSESCRCPLMTSSTVNGVSALRPFFWDKRRRGISVTARRATMDGESTSEARTSRGPLRRWPECSRFKACALSWWRVRLLCLGICTGLDGVGGLVKPVVVRGGLDGERLLPLLSRLAFRFDISTSTVGDGEEDVDRTGLTVTVREGSVLLSACFDEVRLRCGIAAAGLTKPVLDKVDGVEVDDLLDLAWCG